MSREKRLLYSTPGGSNYAIGGATSDYSKKGGRGYLVSAKPVSEKIGTFILMGGAPLQINPQWG